MENYSWKAYINAQTKARESLKMKNWKMENNLHEKRILYDSEWMK